MDRRGPATRLVALLLATMVLAACSSEDDDGAGEGGRAVPGLSGQVFDDPVGDVGPSTFKPEAPSRGVGDVRRVALDTDDGILSITVALQDVAERAAPDERGASYEVSLTGSFTSARSTFEELHVTGRAGDGGAARAVVEVRNDNLEASRELCRGWAGYSRTRGLVRVEVPLACLPGDRLRVTRPTLSVETTGRRFGGEDAVDLGVGRLSAG